MFEAAELGRALEKDVYRKKALEMRGNLLRAQFAAREAKRPVLIIVSGVDGAGKGDVVNALSGWLDVRGLQVHALDKPSDEEADRPVHWRFWRLLPGRGECAVFFGSWYTDPIVRRAYGKLSRAELDREMERVCRLERMLAADGTIIIKLWFHLSRVAQKARFKKLEKSKLKRWKVSDRDRKHKKLYSTFIPICERALRRTDILEAPWHLVEATDERYRDIQAAEIVVAEIQRHLKAQPAAEPAAAAPAEMNSVLASVPADKVLSKKKYAERLAEAQARLSELSWRARQEGISTIAVFEGWDAAGKGGAIRRISQAIDARNRQVISIAAPTDEELAHHYLWRFWRHVPRAGKVTIYDRSWYGRVLVERVEGFAKPEEWERAYGEINEFEEQLVGHRTALVKFWLHVTPEEQLRRFKERERTPHKRHKLTAEDWRNREKTALYEAAINDMVARTSTEFAPWHLVPANDKYYARIFLLNILKQSLERMLPA